MDLAVVFLGALTGIYALFSVLLAMVYRRGGSRGALYACVIISLLFAKNLFVLFSGRYDLILYLSDLVGVSAVMLIWRWPSERA